MTKTERELFKAEFITSDCPSLNEFCRQKGVSIHAVKDYCAKEKWVEQKNEHLRAIAEEVKRRDVENRTKEAIRNIEIRQNETLNTTELIKALIFKMLNNPNVDEKGVNALASSLYRVNEIETTILSGDKTKQHQNDALNQLCETILGATKDEQ